MAQARGLSGKRQDPFRGFKFSVSIIERDRPALPAGGFATVSGLRSETARTEYREGIDDNTMRKLPGLTSFNDITLSKGKSFETVVQQWRNEVFLARSGNKIPDSDIRKDMFVELRNSQNVGVKGWDVLEAWAADIEHSDLDASSSDVFIETLVVANEGHIPKELFGNQNNVLNNIIQTAGQALFNVGRGIVGQ